MITLTDSDVDVKLLPHQIEAANRLSNGKILWGGVGSGKSLTVMAYYLKKEAPKNVYVITTAKKRDSLEWEREAARLGVGTDPTCSVAGSLCVDSWNNISKYEDVEDCFFVFDEQRLVGNGAWVKSFKRIAKRNHWVLLTATPGDTWLDYVPVFIANGFFRNVTEFKQEHVVYKPFMRFPMIDKFINTDVLEKYRAILLVEMPYIRHTKRHIEEVWCEYDRELVKEVIDRRWNIFTNEPCRDAAEMWRTVRRIVNSSSFRVEALQELLNAHPRVIVFYTFDYELQLITDFLTSISYPFRMWNGHKHEEPWEEGLDRWVYLTQYVAGAEGWNCTTTDAMVFWSLTYSYKLFEQAQGRIDRLDTKFVDLWYYVLVSNVVTDRAVRVAQKSKKLFNEVKYAEKLFGNAA